ncbi:hypothetical protein BT67DRAFT_125900 [Trichocladium antarcticum]|uniref:Uncharacterized protein n=1 Tax=Trichocladium antarcticum TaxID=1450529 RepID=A0AAN6URL5_9PEZI|nr:hypothetical protein BT67DRAFT_125900 [Trichocladium antarcticum]
MERRRDFVQWGGGIGIIRFFSPCLITGGVFCVNWRHTWDLKYCISRRHVLATRTDLDTTIHTTLGGLYNDWREVL